MSDRQRFMAFPSSERVIRERQRVCIILRGFAQSADPIERGKYNQAHHKVGRIWQYQHSKGSQPFEWGSLRHFELVLEEVTGGDLT